MTNNTEDQSAEKTDDRALEGSIEEVSHAVVEITKMERVIAELEDKYEKTIFDVSDSKGLKAAKAARKEIREPRFAIENLRKDGKAPILAMGRQLDARANAMKDRLMAIEAPIHDTIKEEEERVERERQEAIEREEKRVAGIRDRIQEFRDAVTFANKATTSSQEIAHVLARIESQTVDDTFEEFQQQASDAHRAAIADLKNLRDIAKEREERDAELEQLRREAEERAEADRLRAEKEAAEKAEREAAEKAKREAEAEAERQRLAKIAEEQAERDREIAEEAAQLQREREALEAEKEAERERELREEAKRVTAEKQDEARRLEVQEAAERSQFPGEKAIAAGLAEHFDISEKTAYDWLALLRNS